MSFRKAPETNWAELKKNNEIPPLKKDEGVLFISLRGNLMQFVSRPISFETVNHVDTSVSVKVHCSERFRIDGGTWSPKMLANYASQVGINLVGIKRFEWYFKEYQEAKRAA